ncbi:acyl-CoA dehydrogenase family protein [Actinomadura sp. 1N219]|uniref:acyl-CoA dehydrogenase family protein n=1 Tax=Actinomadura sp. 1N219 TaxID=3375152 RepID=UPI0037B12D3E
MDDFLLTPEQIAWRDTVRDFVDKSITREYVRECDQERRYPYEAYRKVADQGWFGLLVPEEDGGTGFDLFAVVLLLQELGRYSVDFGAAFAVPAFTVGNIVHHGTAEQRRRYLPDFVAGDVRFSISITEPEAGSDVAAVSTRAVRDGDGFLINGVKMYSSAAHADNNVMCVLARTDPDAGRRDGLSLLLVPADTPGISMTRLPTVARRATGTNQVFFDDVRVPHEALVGEAGGGWRLITEHLEFERLTMAAIYAGNAQQAVADTVAYATTREQFGRPISKFQVIKHTLAQMQTDADIASQLVYRAARSLDLGRTSLREVSMANLMAAELLYKVAGEGMQILGGAAQLPEADLERYWREGKQAMVGGGTSQIQRSIIARTMGL